MTSTKEIKVGLFVRPILTLNLVQKKIELEMVKRDGHEEQKSFEEERQVLESRYQVKDY